MLAFIIVMHVLVAALLILVVLLQPGNKGGVNAALGGAGGDTVFGGRGANTFLSKITFAAATIFMVTNFTLSFMSSPQSVAVDKLLKQDAKPAAAVPAPVQPAAPAAPAAPKP